MKPVLTKTITLVVLLAVGIAASAQTSSEAEGGTGSGNPLGQLVACAIVAAIGVGVLLLLKRDRKGSAKVRTCPSCGGSDTCAPKGARSLIPGVALPQGSDPGRFLLFGMMADPIRIPPLRQCAACGTLWRPACSFGTAIATLVAGFIALGLAIACEYTAFYFCLDDVRRGDRLTLGILIAWLGFGLSLLVISIRVLLRGITLTRGRGCPLEILSRGKAEVEASKA